MQRLLNKTALITGGTSGVGLATAELFVAEGARVAITGRDAARLKAAQRLLGEEVLPLRADGGDIAAQHEIAHTIAAAFGTLDVLFVNAAVADLRAIEQWDEAGFDRSVAVSLKGPFFLIQALLPVLGNPASIVLNTSLCAGVDQPRASLHVATKTALISLAAALSGELVLRGIRVGATDGGPIRPLSPGGGGMSADEIAEAVLCLACNEGAATVPSTARNDS